MSRSPIYLYSRKEIFLLMFLAVVMTLFAFTLGVYVGKRILEAKKVPPVQKTKAIHAAKDVVPTRLELEGQEKGVPKALEKAFQKVLEEEVQHSGIHLKKKRAVRFPKKVKVSTAGNTTEVSAHEDQKALEQLMPTLGMPTPSGRYTLQVGSFPSIIEAQKVIQKLKSFSLPSVFARSVLLKGKGKWYRVYVGGFQTRQEAKKTGTHYRKKGYFSFFLVSKMPVS